MRYRAFLSYSHRDAAFARWLHRRLESYRPPRRLTSGEGRRPRLGPVFRDREELASNSSLSDAVRGALAESEALVVICSPSAAGSRWVNEEIRQFRILHGSDRIFCFIVGGEPNADGETSCFPPALTEAVGNQRREPVAADARSHADGRRDAFLKLAAGMLGVGFDTLKQRELRRRNRRLAAITAGSLAMLVITLALLVSAIAARRDADDRRRQAEDLVDFMLGDLQDELRAIDRLDVFLSVGNKAVEYFTAQREDDESDYTLTQRARNLRQIGEVLLEQGKLNDAMDAFQESLLVTSNLARRAPDNPEAQIGRANSVFYVGYVHWQRGELGAAQERFEDALEIVDAVVATDPGNSRWRMEQVYANTNLGRVLELRGQLPAALDAYERVLAICGDAAAIDPDDAEWQMELGFAHNNIGKLKMAQGQLVDSEDSFRRDLAVKEQFYGRDPNHNHNRSLLATSQYFLATSLAAQGRDDEAERLLLEALDHWRALTDIEPGRLRWGVARARVERALATLYAAERRAADANRMLASSIDALEDVSSREELNMEWRRDLARSLLLGIEIRSTAVAAGPSLGRIADVVSASLERAPRNLETLALSAHLSVCRGELESDASGAATEFQRALGTLDAAFADSRDPRVLAVRARALAGLGRAEDAERTRQTLAETGYRRHRATCGTEENDH